MGKDVVKTLSVLYMVFLFTATSVAGVNGILATEQIIQKESSVSFYKITDVRIIGSIRPPDDIGFLSLEMMETLMPMMSGQLAMTESAKGFELVAILRAPPEKELNGILKLNVLEVGRENTLEQVPEKVILIGQWSIQEKADQDGRIKINKVIAAPGLTPGIYKVALEFESESGKTTEWWWPEYAENLLDGALIVSAKPLDLNSLQTYLKSLQEKVFKQTYKQYAEQTRVAKAQMETANQRIKVLSSESITDATQIGLRMYQEDQAIKARIKILDLALKATTLKEHDKLATVAEQKKQRILDEKALERLIHWVNEESDLVRLQVSVCSKPWYDKSILGKELYAPLTGAEDQFGCRASGSDLGSPETLFLRLVYLEYALNQLIEYRESLTVPELAESMPPLSDAVQSIKDNFKEYLLERGAEANTVFETAKIEYSPWVKPDWNYFVIRHEVKTESKLIPDHEAYLRFPLSAQSCAFAQMPLLPEEKIREHPTAFDVSFVSVTEASFVTLEPGSDAPRVLKTNPINIGLYEGEISMVTGTNPHIIRYPDYVAAHALCAPLITVQRIGDARIILENRGEQVDDLSISLDNYAVFKSGPLLTELALIQQLSEFAGRLNFFEKEEELTRTMYQLRGETRDIQMRKSSIGGCLAGVVTPRFAGTIATIAGALALSPVGAATVIGTVADASILYEAYIFSKNEFKDLNEFYCHGLLLSTSALTSYSQGRIGKIVEVMKKEGKAPTLRAIMAEFIKPFDSKGIKFKTPEELAPAKTKLEIQSEKYLAGKTSVCGSACFATLGRKGQVYYFNELPRQIGHNYITIKAVTGLNEYGEFAGFAEKLPRGQQALVDMPINQIQGSNPTQTVFLSVQRGKENTVMASRFEPKGFNNLERYGRIETAADGMHYILVQGDGVFVNGYAYSQGTWAPLPPGSIVAKKGLAFILTQEVIQPIRWIKGQSYFRPLAAAKTGIQALTRLPRMAVQFRNLLRTITNKALTPPQVLDEFIILQNGKAVTSVNLKPGQMHWIHDQTIFWVDGWGFVRMQDPAGMQFLSPNSKTSAGKGFEVHYVRRMKEAKTAEVVVPKAQRVTSTIEWLKNRLNPNEQIIARFGSTEAVLRFMESRNVLPQIKVESDGTNFYLSNWFTLTNRPAVFVFVEQMGKIHLNLYYRSQSQGVWRVAPALAKDGWFAKEINEAMMNAPIDLQFALEGLTRQHSRVEITRQDIHALVQQIETRFDWASSLAHERFTNSFNEEQPIGTGESKIPSTWRLNKPGDGPDFDKIVQTDFISHGLYGTVQRFVVLSENGQIKYMFMAAKNNVWLGAIERIKSPINPYGGKTNAVDPQVLGTPLYEYNTQVPQEYRGEPIRGNYVEASKYINEIPLIQKARKELLQIGG